jgi:excisionase family DNA binding protein
MGFKFVTPNDIAKECSVTKTTVLRWIEQGHLKAIKLPSGHNRILIEEFERFKKSLGM